MGNKIQRIYIGSNLVRPVAWQPGANTLFYFPFKSDLLDHSGNNVSASGGGTPTYTNPGADITGAFTVAEHTSLSNFTIMVYSKIGNNTWGGRILRRANISASNFYGYDIEFGADGASNSVRVEVLKYPSSTVWKTQYGNIGVTNWHHYCFVANGSTGLFYVDGVLKASKNISGRSPRNGDYVIGAYSSRVQSVSEYILEDKVRTAEEIAEYFNKTKSKYGIS